jgi:hypothetical protein
MTDSAAGEGTGLGRRIGAGREAEVYAWGDDAVIKLYRPGFGGHRAEAAALAALEGRHIAPSLVDVVNHDRRPGLVLERIVGEDMLTLLMRQPWRVHGLARALAEAHLAIHDVRAPADLPDVRQTLSARIEAAVLPRALQGFALRTLDGLPSGDRLCHGDYHPGNVMVGADRVSVIDWPNAARGVPEADHARAILLLRWADPLPGTSLVARGVTAAGRSLLARAYTRAHARGSRRSLQQIESWLVVNVAARLSEGIEAERPKLIGMLARARREERTP